jgi:hypothetical protein
MATIIHVRNKKTLSDIYLDYNSDYKSITETAYRGMARGFAESIRANVGDSVILYTGDKTWEIRAYHDSYRGRIAWSSWKRVKE